MVKSAKKFFIQAISLLMWYKCSVLLFAPVCDTCNQKPSHLDSLVFCAPFVGSSSHKACSWQKCSKASLIFAAFGFSSPWTLALHYTSKSITLTEDLEWWFLLPATASSASWMQTYYHTLWLPETLPKSQLFRVKVLKSQMCNSKQYFFLLNQGFTGWRYKKYCKSK